MRGPWRAGASRSRSPTPARTPSWRRPRGTGWTPSPPCSRSVGSSFPGGTLAAIWSGPDPDSGLIAQARALLSGEGPSSIDDESQAELSAALNDRSALVQALEIPPGVPFDQPEQTVITWDVALDAEDLIGLLGTFSWVILMEDEARERLFETARVALRDMLGVSGDVTVDVGYRAEVWKARRHD